MGERVKGHVKTRDIKATVALSSSLSFLLMDVVVAVVDDGADTMTVSSVYGIPIGSFHGLFAILSYLSCWLSA